MNALAFAALGLASRAAQDEPTLFGALAARACPPSLDRVESSGHAAIGKGAASYIADALCSDELLASHPRFVFREAGGRIFRLLPDAGAIAVEQGGAAGDGAANDQPAVQATIAYAEAIGAREVRFDAPRYRIDCPERTSPADATHAADGHPLIISSSLTLRGNAAEPTVLDFRAHGGADPEAHWQTVPASAAPGAPVAVWRGGGLFVLGELADPCLLYTSDAGDE